MSNENKKSNITFNPEKSQRYFSLQSKIWKEKYYQKDYFPKSKLEASHLLKDMVEEFISKGGEIKKLKSADGKLKKRKVGYKGGKASYYSVETGKVPW